jgi:DNA repair exonuclease SbcCD nuclease subunit
VYNNGKNRFELSAPQDDYFNLCVIHGETRSDLNGNYRPITPEYVKYSGMDYIALGHVHSKSQIQYVGTTALAYSGCPEGQGFDESGEKGVYMGEVSKGNINLEFVPTALRTHIRLDVDITDKDDIFEEIVSAIKENENYENHYYRITLKGKRNNENGIDINSLVARLSPLVSFIKIKDKTILGADLNELAREKNLKGYFTSIMLSKIENADENEKEKYRYALELGLKAFSEEVNFNED